MYCTTLTFYGVYNSYTFSYSQLLTWVQAGLKWMTLTFALPFMWFCAYLSFDKKRNSAQLDFSTWYISCRKYSCFRRLRQMSLQSGDFPPSYSPGRSISSRRDPPAANAPTPRSWPLTPPPGWWLPVTRHTQWLKGPTFYPSSELCFWSRTPAEIWWINLQIK